MEPTGSDDDYMTFLAQNGTALDKLFAPALRALSVPASVLLSDVSSARASSYCDHTERA